MHCIVNRASTFHRPLTPNWMMVKGGLQAKRVFSGTCILSFSLLCLQMLSNTSISDLWIFYYLQCPTSSISAVGLMRWCDLCAPVSSAYFGITLIAKWPTSLYIFSITATCLWVFKRACHEEWRRLTEGVVGSECHLMDCTRTVILS